MQPLTKNPETGDNSSETNAPTLADLNAVADLLAGEGANQDDQDERGDADSQDDQDGADAGDDQDGEKSETTKAKPAKPKTLAELAETLGAKVSDLYEIEIPFDAGDGESRTRTLGEIKDAIGAQDSLELERLQFDETKRNAEKEIRKNSQDLADIVSALPRAALSKDLLAKVARHRAQLVSREERMTAKVIPDWQNQDIEAKDREAISQHLSEYGFPDDYLDSLVDHRTLALLRDSTLRKQRIDAALAQVRKVSKPGHKPSARPAKKANNSGTSRRGARVNNQIQQVAELLNSD